MAFVTWSILNPNPRLESISRRFTRWSRFTGNYGVESENTLAGLIALVSLPAAFVASLAFSLPLALPPALATINLSVTGERRGTARRAGRAELVLAMLLALIAVFFAVLAINGAVRFAALTGVVLSITFAGLPPILRLLMTESRDDGTAHSRDDEGLDRLMPDERLVVVERNGRVAAASRSVTRQFAASGLKPGTDILQLIDFIDRPLLLNALDKAAQHEQVVSLRLDAGQCARQPEATRIDLSLAAIDSRTVIIRLYDMPPALPDRGQVDHNIAPAIRHTNRAAGEGACDLEEAARFAIRLLAGEADKQGVLVTMKEQPSRDAETELLVNCPARVARQIALNVIDNAIKFSHSGGQVTIETDVDGESGLLRIADQGVGIAERDREALFYPHKRGGDSNRRSWGLGLAIVGDLVAGCDGWINVKSASGKGTTVTIRLPSVGMDGEVGQFDMHCLGNQSRELERAA